MLPHGLGSTRGAPARKFKSKMVLVIASITLGLMTPGPAQGQTPTPEAAPKVTVTMVVSDSTLKRGETVTAIVTVANESDKALDKLIIEALDDNFFPVADDQNGGNPCRTA